MAEQHQADVEVTEHPVEKGANIADHIRPKPEMITIDGVITDTPIPAPETPIALRRDKKGAAADAHAVLLRLKNSGELVTVVTALRTYQNMALKALSIPRDAKQGEVLRFSAAFVNVSQVETKTETVGLPKNQKKNLGKKAAKQADTKTEARPRSALKSIGLSTGLVSE